MPHILALGDSWAAMGSSHLQAYLGPSYKVVVRAKLGVGACDTANSTSFGVASFLERAPPPGAIVWLSLGANDIHMERRQRTVLFDPAAERARECLTKVVRTLLEYDPPPLRIIQFGYDLLCLNDRSKQGYRTSDECPDAANATCFNHRMWRLSHEVLAPVAARSVPARRHRFYDLLGTLQADAGIAGARPGEPRLDVFTPESYFVVDCTHPTPKGFRVLFEELNRRGAFSVAL